MLEARGKAARFAVQRTTAELRSALGESVALKPRWQRLRRLDRLAAEAEAHAVSSRYLESEMPGGRAFLPEFERRAAWEADQAFNQARRESLERLPKKLRDKLWLRWDTAGDQVCPQCDKLDGRTVPIDEGFDPPAPLHGNCRCTETILTAAEV